MSANQAVRVYHTCFLENTAMSDELKIQGASILYDLVKDKIIFLKALSARNLARAGDEDLASANLVCVDLWNGCVCVYVTICLSVYASAHEDALN